MLSPLPDQRKSAARENPLPTSAIPDPGNPAADPARVSGEALPAAGPAGQDPEAASWDIYAWSPPRVDTSQAAVYAAARRYVASGLSVIPIAADGTKAPDRQRLPMVRDEETGRWRATWEVFQVIRPGEEALRLWFYSTGFVGFSPGLAVVTGGVSGSLE